MPKYYEYKIAGYYLYFTSYCVIEKIMVIQYYKIGESLMTEKSGKYKRLSNKTTRKCI